MSSPSAPPGLGRRALLAVGLSLAAMLAAVALAPSAQAQALGTFEALASSPEPMSGVTVDPTTGIVYGQGYDDNTWYSYNPATNTWTTLAPDPTYDNNAAGAAYLNGKIYLSFPSNSGLEVYDIASNTWTSIANNPSSDTGDITAVGGLLYFADATTFVSYDPATGTTTTLAAPPGFTGDCAGGGFEAWGALVPLNGKIYGTQGDGCNGFAVYDIASNSWTELAHVPGDTTLGGAIDPVSQTFYAYGSYGGDNWYSYNIASGTWATPAAWPAPPLNDGGMAYVATPGLEGIYAVQGDDGTAFERFVTPAPPADLSLTKKASKAKVTKGKDVTYTIKVSNAGPAEATSTTVTDKLPGSMKFVSSSASQGTCSGTTTVTCNLGTVAAGASATVTITVKTTHTGKVTNTAKVSSAAPDSNTANNSASATVNVVAAIKPLRLSVTPGHAQAGTRTCFRFRASSNGHGVRGVDVTLAGHRRRTSGSGRATLCVSLKKGAYHARASKKGYRSASAAVRITAAPAFTG